MVPVMRVDPTTWGRPSVRRVEDLSNYQQSVSDTSSNRSEGGKKNTIF